MRTLLTLDEVAVRINRSPNTLRYWRRMGEGPISFRVGRRVFYDESDVAAWIEAQRAATAVGGL